VRAGGVGRPLRRRVRRGGA